MPHHNLVQSIRQQFLKDITIKRPVTNKIILIGPDHFSGNQFQIVSSDRDWDLSTGVFKYEKLLDLPINNFALQNDHTIYNPLADLKTYFPKSTIFPILIGQKVRVDQLDKLIKQIISVCHSDCLLVASVDFSHYLPATLAEVHDAFTINSLENLNTAEILRAEVDSPQSLYVLTKFSHGKKFNLFAHTNSGIISQNPDVETTTHVFGSYSLGFPKRTAVFTSVSIPYNLDRQQNQNSVGDRFFYGVNQFQIDTSNSFVTSTITSSSQTVKSFLPIKANLFVRGFEKQKLIKEYFDSLSPELGLITKDYYWGKLIYERN